MKIKGTSLLERMLVNHGVPLLWLILQCVMRVGCFALGFFLISSSQAQTVEPNELGRFIAGIREGHKRVLRHPKGIAIRYRLDFKEGPKKLSYFAFKQGVDGLLNIRWPEVRCRVEGPISFIWRENGISTIKTQPHVRQGCFNFETFSGVAHDGNEVGQITNFRHPFSASSGYPLRFQCFVEMEQFYVPEENLETDYWLPNALEQHPYSIDETESINGISCQVLRRKGMDTLWIAPDYGYIIVKREFHYGVGKPIRERIQNLNLKEVVHNLWMPMKQIREEFDATSAGELVARFTLQVLELRAENVTDGDMRVVLPDTVRYIEDHITGKVYHPGLMMDAKQLDTSVLQVRKSNPALSRGRHPLSWTFLLFSLAVFQGIIVWRLIWYHGSAVESHRETRI